MYFIWSLKLNLSSIMTSTYCLLRLDPSASKSHLHNLDYLPATSTFSKSWLSMDSIFFHSISSKSLTNWIQHVLQWESKSFDNSWNSYVLEILFHSMTLISSSTNIPNVFSFSLSFLQIFSFICVPISFNISAFSFDQLHKQGDKASQCRRIVCRDTPQGGVIFSAMSTLTILPLQRWHYQLY